jgi:PAS domain S-box-containing protein
VGSVKPAQRLDSRGTFPWDHASAATAELPAGDALREGVAARVCDDVSATREIRAMARHNRGQSSRSERRASRTGEESALAAIVRSSHDAVIAKTVEGVVTSWNEGAHLLYGYPAEAMVGRNIEVTVPSEAMEEERARHARVATGEPESGYRCVRVRANGQPVEVVMSMSPMCDARGRVVGVASISRPVSDKERADARFASLLEAAPDAIICIDHDGRIAMVNAQVSTLFGYGPEELIGSPLETLLPEEVRRRLLQHQADLRVFPTARSMGLGLELSARRCDGSMFPAEVSLAPSNRDGGGDDMVIAAVRDVSKQRAIETSVRESEARFRQLAESVDLVFVLLQLDPPAFLYISPGCRTILGIDPDELIANPALAYELVHPDDSDRVSGSWFASTRVGEAATSEHRIVRPDGSHCWVRSSCAPVSHPSGKAQRAVITVEDISERVRSAEALREAELAARAANDAKSEFLSRMSHELRTPLNAVLGFGQLLDRRLPDSEYSEYIGHILSGGRHLLGLINDVLDIAGIESGEMSVSLERVPVAGLVDETVQLMQPLAAAAGITLIRTTVLAQLSARADRQRLRQILLNLLSNAVKYNRPNGNVWIEVLATGTDNLTIVVRDDGPGIAAELLPRVFTPFDRLGAEAGTIEGTGIGLALTRSLAELMGGRVSLTSELGHGCAFAVTLPRAPRPGQVDQPALDAPPAPPRARPSTEAKPFAATVLYIEDNEPNVRVVEHVVALRPGWVLMHAGLGTLGIELARAHQPDLVLLDLHLPDRSGYQVLSALKLNPATSSIPVAILTADANQSQAQRLLAAGAIRYLTKPLDIGEVLVLLDEVGAGRVASLG